MIRSKSVPQLLARSSCSSSAGTDLLEARQLVQERIAIVDARRCPTWASPPFMIQPLSATSRVMKIGLSSDTLSTIDMSMIAYWKIRARLLRVPGVANVPIWGERLEMLQVQVDPARLKANNVTLDEVMDVTADALDAGLLRFSDGGFIGTGGVDRDAEPAAQHPPPAVHPLARRPGQGARSAPKAADGSPLVLADVADVKIDHQPLIGDAVINGGPGLMLIVEKLPWANTLDVTEGVEEAHRTRCSRACPASRSTPRSSGRPPSSSCRSTT